MNEYIMMIGTFRCAMNTIGVEIDMDIQVIGVVCKDH